MALDFPSPSTTAEVSTGDITWKWNGYAWYATTDATQVIHVGVNPPTEPRSGQMWWCSDTAAEGGGRLYVYFQDANSSQWVDASLPGGGQGGDFLSKTENDTAAGIITFESRTVHNDGATFANRANFNGAMTVRGDQSNILSDTLISTCPNVQFRGASTASDPTCATFALYNTADSTDASAVTINTGTSNGFDRPSYKGIHVFDIGSNQVDHERYGIYSEVGVNPAAKNYNFYAEGTAPSFFKANTLIGSPNTSMSNDVGVEEGIVLGGSGRIGQHVTLDDTSDNNASFTMWKHGSNKGTFISFNFTGAVGNGNSNLCGRIKGVGSGAVNYEDTSDYRLKQNIQPLGTAVDLVKQLKPSTFEYINEPGVTYQGFVAHELQEICPLAVSGVKDETQIVGTLTDLDGNSEYNVPEPTVVPAGSSFTATGTEDVPQGVDQRRLIPLLTKALQEALNRIEALESNEVVDDATDSALLTLVANLATRVTALEGA